MTKEISMMTLILCMARELKRCTDVERLLWVNFGILGDIIIQ